ncbi:MAG TPA: IS110 family transposase [Acidimicrobiales bacterium]|nr:IS110 family transposase [Acidimicrobiales bacterium]
MTIVERTRLVTGGVDTHLDVHVAAALDEIGGVLGVESFEATPAGNDKLLSWLASFGTVCRVGVEGTGSYGAGLARFLRSAEVDVVEVDRPNRQTRRRTGKSDPADAVEAARAALSGRSQGAGKTRDGNVEAIRALVVAKRSCRSTKIRTLNQIRHLGFTASDDLRERFRGVSRFHLGATAAALRPRATSDTVTYATKTALSILGRRVLALDEEKERLDALLAELVTATAPQLLELHGVGIDTAAALLVAAGDNPGRLRSEAAWAHLCGAAPVPASSGKVTRYRLNRGGDRQANAALYVIVITRMNSDPRTRAYVERRLAEGKAKSEIIRILKRYVAREVYRHLPRN